MMAPPEIRRETADGGLEVWIFEQEAGDRPHAVSCLRESCEGNLQLSAKTVALVVSTVREIAPYRLVFGDGFDVVTVLDASAASEMVDVSATRDAGDEGGQ